MKKLIIMVLLLNSMMAISQDKLTFSSDFELGCEQFKEAIKAEGFNEINFRYESPWLMESILEMGIHYKNFSIKGSSQTYFSDLSENTITFKVHYVNYVANINYKYNIFELGYIHECLHPIYTSHMYMLTRNSSKFYLKIKIK